MKKILLAFTVFLLTFIFSSNVFATQASKNNEYLEETLLAHYSPLFLEITKGQPYYCEKIISLTRIKDNSNQHRITVQLITFNGPHNPPYDLYIVDFIDGPSIGSNNYPYKAKIIKIDSKMNISIDEAKKSCGK